MPHRRPKPSLVIGAVAVLAVASPLAVFGLTSTPSGIQATNESSPTVVDTEIAQVALEQVPDIVIPLKELTGLNLPDVNIGQLRSIPIPSSIEIPKGIELPGGLKLPSNLEIPLERPEPSDVSDPTAPAEEQAGAVVKELTRDTPFSMVALTSDTLASAESKVRAMQEDGTWGEWFSPAMVDSRATDQAEFDGTIATEPIFVGATKAIQILTPKILPEQAAPAAPSPAPAPEAAPAPAPEAAPETLAPVPPAPEAPLGYTPASVNKPLHQQPATQTGAQDVTAVLIDPGSSPVDGNLTDIATPVAGSGPKVITRAQWGADESIRCQGPHYDDFLGGATVHHTAGNNNYSRAESANIVRGIYAYHAQTLGWCDIGYNVLVDKYGQIFEGRFGGLDRPVQGAHSGGFNENTMGIAMMGDYSFIPPAQATIDSVGKFLGWRLGKAGLDPKGHTTMYSEGTSFTPYARGQAVDLPIIFAHRDVGNTSCPGNAAYARMDEIRNIAAANVGTSLGVEAAAPPAAAPQASPNTSPGTNASAELVEKLPVLVSELARMADESPIVQDWLAQGGEAGRLGKSLTGLLNAQGGAMTAQFLNGALFTSVSSGEVFTVIGEIYNTYKGLGLDGSKLGLPISDEYAVPGGFRSDFEHGSLIFNAATGAMTKIVDTAGPAAAPAPEPAPAPAPAPAPPAPVS